MMRIHHNGVFSSSVTHRLAIVLVAMIVSSPCAKSESYNNVLPAELSEMGVTEHLGETIPLSLEFQDETGRMVSLRQFFRLGRPVLLSFNYSNCPMLCSLQLSGLVTSLSEVDLQCGRDFELISVSIDPRESPLRAAQTRQKYYQMYGREGTGAGWHFLVGSEQAIVSLAKSVGFTYRYLPERKEYVHAAVCASVTPDGRLSRYLYGVAFPPQTLRLALVEASSGQIGTTLDQILLFCFHYDAASGRYAPAARRLMTVAGAAMTLVLGTFLVGQFARERRHRQQIASRIVPQAVDLCGNLTVSPSKQISV